MSEIATARINTFGNQPKADFVSPSEQLITLTYGQLADLVTQAVEKAIEPLQDRIESLESTVTGQGEEIASLKAQMTTQEKENKVFSDNTIILFRLVNQLRAAKKEPGKTEATRADKIAKYLAARQDRRATFETLKGHLGIDKDLLNDTIKTLMASSPGRYGIVRVPGDKRKRALIMLPK